MKYKIKAYGIQEFGQRKDAQGNPHQEDSMFPALGDLSYDARTFILCDGMGGHDAGEVASATVCEAMSRAIANDGHDKEGIFTDKDFEDALEAAFDALDDKDNGAEKKMGTTMTFLKLYNEGAFIAHMGDSRVYHIRPGKNGKETEILFQTADHSLINDLIKIGELTPEEARKSGQKNVITRAMQPHMDKRMKADIHKTTDIKAGDYFYMCSDGMLEDPDMEEGTTLRNIFSQLGGDDINKVKILTDVTEKNKDNHTAFIIHIIEVIDSIKPSTKDLDETDSRFAAIVEEDEEPAPRASEAPKASMPTRQNPAQMETNMPKMSVPSKKPFQTNIVRLVVCLVTVAILTAAILWFRSCNADKNQQGKEPTEQPVETETEEETSQHADNRQMSAKSPDANRAATTPVANPMDSPQQTPEATPQSTEEAAAQPEKKPLIQSVTNALGKKTQKEESTVEETLPAEDQQIATPKKEQSENEEQENKLETESV